MKRLFLNILLIDIHSWMSVGFLVYLFMTDLSPGCLFAVVVI